MTWKRCEHCQAQPTVIHTNGVGFCSAECQMAAQAKARRDSREASERTWAARLRSNLVWIGVSILAIAALMTVSGQAKDERKESHERLATYGRVTWDVSLSQNPFERTPH